MNNLIQLNYNGSEIRTIDDNGQVWWVLSDICKTLDLTTPSKVVKRLDEDEVNQIHIMDSLGRKQKMTVINESGLYSVILRSDKPEAKPFRRWITHEVLPEIHRTGSYSLATTTKAVKTWYSVPVMTIEDAAEQLGVTRGAARKKIINCLRGGLDYFVLIDYHLQMFKFENQECSATASKLLLIRTDSFKRYFNI